MRHNHFNITYLYFGFQRGQGTTSADDLLSASESVCNETYILFYGHILFNH